MRPASLVFAIAALAAGLAVAGHGAAGPSPPPLSLSWPVDCRLGVDCEIERYMDDDPSPTGARDYACGARTQNGHDGTDIRLPDMAAQKRGVTVKAAADGMVRAIRDGVADVSVRTVGVEAVDSIGCGNVVVIVHPGGFQTAYCHMAKGSVRVKPGDVVKAGQPIGRIGLSGLTEFPHLHFQVRHDGALVDPFAYGAPPGACSGGVSLWREPLAYRAEVIANMGFAAGEPTLTGAIDGDIPTPAASAGVITAYARALGLKAGDVEAMTLRAPDGSMLQSRHPPLARDRSQDVMYIGRRRPPQGWPQGRYDATYTVTGADGRLVLSRSFALEL